MATTIKFKKLFGKSYIKPMKKHMELATECARLVPPAVEAYAAGDNETLKDLQRAVIKLEDEADAILEEIQSSLPKSMFMPVDRRDLLDVLEMQEAIADRTQDILGLMVELPLQMPDDMKQPLGHLAQRCIEACEDAEGVVKSLKDLVEAGFKGPVVEEVQKLIAKTIRVETDADSLGIQLSHTLFQHRADLDPTSVVFLFQLFNWIDDLADYAEKLVIRFRLFLAR